MSEELQLLYNAIGQVLARQGVGGVDPLAATRNYGHEITWTQFKAALKAGRVKPEQVVLKTDTLDITVNPHPLYGCSGIFGLCGPDDVIGMCMGDDPLIEWLGFRPDTICEKFIKVWTYTDVEGTGAGSPETAIGDPCSDPPEAEYDAYELPWHDFGVIHMCGKGVPLTIMGKRKCDKQPTYTLPLAGFGRIRIDNDLDLERISAAQAARNELSRRVITGRSTTQWDFGGIAEIVNTGYVDIKGNRRYSADSIVVNWAYDQMDGLVNGHGNIVWKIRDIWRQLMWRFRMADRGLPQEGDAVLLMPSWLAYNFLDAWSYATLWQGGALGNQVIHDNLAMREFRDRYASGLFNAGHIVIDNFRLHILAHDWMSVNQSAPYFCGDIYLLVRQLGPNVTFTGQYMPAEMGVTTVNQIAGQVFGTMPLKAGRAVTWLKQDNACVKPCLMIMPRLWCPTPWANAVINNVCVSRQFEPFSQDPQSNYFVEKNKVGATTTTQYWYGNDGWFHPPS